MRILIYNQLHADVTQQYQEVVSVSVISHYRIDLSSLMI